MTIAEACERAAREVIAECGLMDKVHVNAGWCDYAAEKIVAYAGAGEVRALDGLGHFVAKINGRYYDVEAPQGVDHPNQLPYARRKFRLMALDFHASLRVQ